MNQEKYVIAVLKKLKCSGSKKKEIRKELESDIAAALENKARVIACSALLTTTMREMAKVVEAVKEAGLSGQVKVMIGGAPVTQSFCDSIGADCYTPDAASCAEAAYGFCCA